MANFRQYRKIWDDSHYADTRRELHRPRLRRFLSLWAFDWSSGERRPRSSASGSNPPAGATSAQLYYAQLTNKFNDEMSHSANQLSAAFHEAIIQQSRASARTSPSTTSTTAT